MRIASSSLLYAVVVVLTVYAGASAMQSPQDKKPARPAAPATTPPPKAPDAKPAMKPQDEHSGHNQAPQPLGAEHKQLAKYVGDWTYGSTMTMAGAPPMESTGTAKITTVLGGRFLLEENKGEMMGQPVESRHYTGYNTDTKKYEANWTWTMNTSMMNMTGTSSDGGKTIVSSAVVDGPEKMNLKITHTFIDDDHFTMEMTSEGPDGGSMVTKYTRKK